MTKKTSGIFSPKFSDSLRPMSRIGSRLQEKTSGVFSNKKDTRRLYCYWVTGVVVALATETALACPVCFRVEESATTNGVRVAVVVLVGVTAMVLGAFARFIVGFARRERNQCPR